MLVVMYRVALYQYMCYVGDMVSFYKASLDYDPTIVRAVDVTLVPLKTKVTRLDDGTLCLQVHVPCVVLCFYNPVKLRL